MKQRHAFLALAVTILFCNSGFSQINLSSSLTACYALDGNASEPINVLTGTLGAVTPTVNRFGTPNSAYFFNGNASSYIALPNSPLIKSNAISFSCWVKLDQVASHQILAFAHNGCTSYHEGYYLAYEIGLGFRVAKANSSCSPAGQSVLNSYAPVLANTWYHLGFYAGADSLKLYVNGSLLVSLANTNPIVYNPNSLVYLGGTNLPFNFPMKGSMDNVRFYNRKLSNAEMNQLYLTDPVCLGGSAPTASFSVSKAKFCVKEPVTLSDQSSNAPTSWSWQMPGATPAVSTVSNPVISYSTPGTYNIFMTSSNNFGQSSTATKTVVVGACTSLKEEATDEYFIIYPNPSEGKFQLRSLENNAVEFVVYDVLGHVVANGSVNASGIIDISSHPNGIYFIEIKTGEKPVIKKMIKG